MARSVFYSFHYQNDISRVMTVRHRWVTYGTQMVSGIIDHAEFEKVQRQGKATIERWIDQQLTGTTATIVLIGAETLNRPYVQYEIRKSRERGNAVIGVFIHRIKDLAGRESSACSVHTPIGLNDFRGYAFFDQIATGIYDYVLDDGYSNLDKWVDSAIRKQRGL